MIKVLFISLSNKHRSPSARAIFSKIIKNHKLEHRFFIESSSILQESSNVKLSPSLISLAESKGYDLSDHRTNNIRLEKLSEFDYIIVFDNDDHKAILKLTNPAIHTRINKLTSFSHDHHYKEIKDPKGEEENLDFMFNILENNLHDLFAHIKMERKLH